MTPILFPYTTISARHREAVGRFFPALTLLRPLEAEPTAQDAITDGLELRYHIPATDRRAELRRLIDDYRRWAQQHPGTDLSAWAGRGETVPFFDETSPAHIRSEIRRGDPAAPAADPLFDCRLFLGMAETFDHQTAETAQRLANLENAESRMLGQLRGETQIPLRPSAHAEAVRDALTYMLPRRIRAWSGLYLSAPRPTGIFITLARDVIDHLAEICGPDRIRCMGTIAPPETRSVLIEQLEAAAAAPRPEGALPIGAEGAPGGSGDSRLEIYLAPDRKPEKFFAVFSPRGMQPAPMPVSSRHTLVGLLTG